MQLGYFPTPYKEESFFSLIFRCRVHLSIPWGNAVNSLISGFFKGSNLLFPVCIEKFVKQLPSNTKLTSGQIIQNHSLYQYYAFFLDEKRREALLKTLLQGGDIGDVGLGVADNTHQERSIKCCQLCAKEDKEKIGEIYFRRFHQIRGVTSCAVHGVNLLKVPLGNTEKAIRQFDKQCNFDYDYTAEKSDIRSVKFAQLSKEILLSPELPTKAHISTLIATRLERRGCSKVASGGYRLFPDKMTQLLEEKGCPVLTKQLLEKISTGGWRYPRSVTSLSNGARNYDIVLILMSLGISVKRILEQKTMNLSAVKPQVEMKCLNPTTKCSNTSIEIRRRGKGRFFVLCNECGFIYTGHSTNIGNKRSRWVRDYGHSWREKLKECWGKPEMNIDEMSKLLGFRASLVLKEAFLMKLVEQLGDSGKNFSTLRKKKVKRGIDALFIVTRDEKRIGILSYFSSHPKATPESLAGDVREAYMWLTKNDKEWVRANTPKILRATRGSRLYSDAEIETLDEELSRAIEEAGAYFQANLPRTRISKNMLAHHHSSKTSSAILSPLIEKLPKTQEALKANVETEDEYFVRKLKTGILRLPQRKRKFTPVIFSEMTGMYGDYYNNLLRREFLTQVANRKALPEDFLTKRKWKKARESAVP